MGGKPSSDDKKDHTVLTEEEIEFLINQTKYTRETIADYHKKFLGICPKGEFDKKGFIKYFTEMRPDKDTEVFCSQLFTAFDIDKSGKVDFLEFLVAVTLATDPDPRNQLSFVFRMYDNDRNNRLDKKEIEKLILGIYNFTGQKNRSGSHSPSEVAKQMLAKYDADGNGYLTEDEFLNGIADQSLSALKYFSIFKTGF